MNKQFYTEQSQEKKETITREEWEKGYHWRPLTKERMKTEMESPNAPLTKYLEGEPADKTVPRSTNNGIGGSRINKESHNEESSRRR